VWFVVEISAEADYPFRSVDVFYNPYRKVREW
jgi:hypothetical protein